LYIFTNNVREQDHDWCYRWANSKISSSGVTAIATCEYVEELAYPPESFESEEEASVISPNTQITLSWSEPSKEINENFQYNIWWICGEKQERVDVNKEKTSYTLALKDLPRGEDLTIRIATKIGEIYSEYLELEKTYRINSLPKISAITFTSSKISES
jgi:hypothetical protein